MVIGYIYFFFYTDRGRNVDAYIVMVIVFVVGAVVNTELLCHNVTHCLYLLAWMLKNTIKQQREKEEKIHHEHWNCGKIKSA